MKNKLVPPFKIAEFELQFGKGICKETEIIDLSVKNKLISKAGAMFYYNEQSFRGKDALKNFLALEMWLMVSSACFHCCHMLSNFSPPLASLYHMFFGFL